MKRAIAIVLANLILSSGVPAQAEDHLVSPAEAQARLQEAPGQRPMDIAAVRSVLASPSAVSAAAGMGLDLNVIAARIASLSDDELRELAQRAALLHTDPTAGGIRKTVIIIVLVLAVLLALSAWAIHEGCKNDPTCFF
jgi:uncharacterized membrane protein YdbT with pleckstrin-like domain